jgi:hypothetical protein
LPGTFTNCTSFELGSLEVVHMIFGSLSPARMYSSSIGFQGTWVGTFRVWWVGAGLRGWVELSVVPRGVLVLTSVLLSSISIWCRSSASCRWRQTSGPSQLQHSCLGGGAGGEREIGGDREMPSYLLPKLRRNGLPRLDCLPQLPLLIIHNPVIDLELEEKTMGKYTARTQVRKKKQRAKKAVKMAALPSDDLEILSPRATVCPLLIVVARPCVGR